RAAAHVGFGAALAVLDIPLNLFNLLAVPLVIGYGIDDHVFLVHRYEEDPSLGRLTHVFLGRRKDLRDPGIFHSMALVPFLAWVGLGADGLSSSAYGPEEAFRNLGHHSYLAVALAALTALTVMVISASYSQIIEAFPAGGGGYVVSTKLLGKYAG